MAQVAALIERTRPDVIVTFGPDGMTGHPDHQTVSAWVTEAWRPGRMPAGPSGTRPRRPEFQEEWDDLHQQLDIWFDGQIAPVDARLRPGPAS